jgi:hypothetical protein
MPRLRRWFCGCLPGKSRRADFQGDGGRFSFSVDMDDLALQFDGTDAGKRFIEAWKRARIIVDTGGGHSGTPPTPPTPPATPGK